MRHSLSKDTAFNGETTPRHTFLCSDSQCLPPSDSRILCSKHGSPITGKSFIIVLVRKVQLQWLLIKKVTYIMEPVVTERYAKTIDHSRNTITYHNALSLSPQNFA